MDLNISLNDKKGKKGQKKWRKNSMFSERKEHPLVAVVSVCMAAAALISLFLLVFLSFASDGKSGVWTGGIGMLMLIVTTAGLTGSLFSFRKPEISWKYPMIGSIGNGILMILYGMIYISGIGFF